MRFHKSSFSRFPSWSQLRAHMLTLVLGVVLAFSGLRVLSSQAAPTSILPPSPTDSAMVALAPNIPGGSSFVSAAVDKVGPAVVRIDTERTITRRVDPFFDDPFFRRFFGGEDMMPQFPTERRQRGQGSGFIVDRSGLLLTNAHVVKGADRVTVTLKDGRSFEGQVRGTDEVTDLALVKINPRGSSLPVAPLGDSSQIRVGDWAIAVGNPLGLDNTVTLGIVSTLDRSSAQAGIPDKRLDFIQTDAAINPGNSGGPLVNQFGEVIGINTAIRADAMGIGFAIPINKAKVVKDTLASGQKVDHPYIGIQMVTLTPDLAKENNSDPNSPFLIPEVDGVLVVGVLPNTPAAGAGIRRGDVILQVDGKNATSADVLQDIVENSGVDTNLRVKLQRGNRTLELTVRTAQLGDVS
ncbi:MAG: trypsin-like serine protease [Oscillatoria sp. SIO1A7]|nr:trypsin-like serine protease [Oscillatoria sp. SIO1A7]